MKKMQTNCNLNLFSQLKLTGKSFIEMMLKLCRYKFCLVI